MLWNRTWCYFFLFWSPISRCLFAVCDIRLPFDFRLSAIVRLNSVGMIIIIIIRMDSPVYADFVWPYLWSSYYWIYLVLWSPFWNSIQFSRNYTLDSLCRVDGDVAASCTYLSLFCAPVASTRTHWLKPFAFFSTRLSLAAAASFASFSNRYYTWDCVNNCYLFLCVSFPFNCVRHRMYDWTCLCFNVHTLKCVH